MIATSHGGGISFTSALLDLEIVDTSFEHCLAEGTTITSGGAVHLSQQKALKVQRCRFIECRTQHGGGALCFYGSKDISISDTLVKKCYSGTTGAIFIVRNGNPESHVFSHVLFEGNTVGDDTTYFTNNLKFDGTLTKFADVAIICTEFTDLPTLTLTNCYTTVSPDSSGIIVGRKNPESDKYDPELILDDNSEKIGPLLTAKPTAKMNEKTGKIELEMEGKTPLTSQEYSGCISSHSS
ncbi:hypothetical protein BLNAU_24998 [Blattamonas nauphoetae]|uniref:Right handed beta helix domain-containing protein n=1 Tax=Blattamonas nauphoetae TaxID=2049346 RepID=A0ABQ9WKT1_9EUKA|nr:hypothetical protein BLNAU_24998 [Blattamonas nauphoetae]